MILQCGNDVIIIAVRAQMEGTGGIDVSASLGVRVAFLRSGSGRHISVMISKDFFFSQRFNALILSLADHSREIIPVQ